MKRFLFIILLIPIFVTGQVSKKSIIENTLLAIETSEDASYESVVNNIEKTPADTTLIWKSPLIFTYRMNPYDTFCYMNFTYEKREKTFNIDRIVNQVYNGMYYYSVQNIENDTLPEPEYRMKDMSNPYSRIALQKAIKGQIPHIYKVLKEFPENNIVLKGFVESVEQKFAKLGFMDDPVFEYVVWIDLDTFLPVKIEKIAHVNRNKPQLLSVNNISNYNFPESGINDVNTEFKVDRFIVKENQINTDKIETEVFKRPKLLAANSLVPEIKQYSVTDSLIVLNGLNGQISLVYFGMISCCPCIKSLPHLKKIYQVFSGRNDFRMMAFYPYDPPAVLKKYVEKESLGYSVCAGKKDVVTAFGLHAFPAFVLINRSGEIYKWYQFDENISDKLATDINKLLKNL